MRNLFLLAAFLLFTQFVDGQTITGVIRDNSTGESVIGAVVTVKGSSLGTTTDLDGQFSLKLDQKPPVILVISYVGYQSQEINVSDLSKGITVKLRAKEVELKDVEVTGSRISEKQKTAPLTVESMDIIAIK
jgi:hypothetical protein